MTAMSIDSAIALYAPFVCDPDESAGLADPRPRPRVKDSIVFDEFHAQNYSCLVCERRPVNAAHLIGKGRRGDDVEANLIPLCGSGSHGCHGAYDNGHAYTDAGGRRITPELVKLWIAAWLLSEDGEDARWYVTQKLGLGGSQEFLRSLGVDPDDQEPREATKDPRPDPRTHPEYWCE